MRGNKELKSRKQIFGLLAILLFSGFFAASAYAINGGDCGACHTDVVANALGIHHAARDRINATLSPFSPLYLSCGSCHNYIGYGTPTSSKWCTDCHAATKHIDQHDQAQAPPVDCQVCHNINAVAEHTSRTNLRNCATCHAGSPPSGAASADGVTITAATTTAAINKGWSLLQPVNCTDCHGPDAGDHTAAHDPVTPAGCTDCHAGNLVTEHLDGQGLTCNTCHDNQRTDPAEKQMVIAAIAAGIINGSSVSCTSCHSTAGQHLGAHQKTIILAECAGCHGADIPSIHFVNPANDCLTCHLSADPNVLRVIDEGKSGVLAEVNCADCHGSNAGNHTAEHDYAKIPPGCNECHAPNVVNEHVDNRGFTCTTCHDNARTEVQAAITDGKNNIAVYCDRCHAGTPHSTARHDSGLAVNCESCHVSDLPSEHLSRPPLTCGSCHNSIDTVVQTTIANGKLGQTYDCSDCHGAFAGDHLAAHNPVPTSTACAECHIGADNVVTLHVTNMGLSCSTCHDSTVTAVKNAITTGSSPNDGSLISCGSCHDNAGQHLNAHLRTVKAVECESCHAGNLPSVHFVNPALNCMTCHNGTYDAVINSTGEVNCASCHGAGAGDHSAVHAATDVPSSGCASCHSPDVYVEHITKRSLGCAICHSGNYTAVINKPGVVVCSDCHLGSAEGHHAGTDALTGNCTVCHKVPDWAMDAPKQAACRQCHGANKHGKGGPIQDFGACFACHSPKPYHAKPITWPGWYQENATASGRGTFNIFFNEFTPRWKGDGEDTMEDRSGYGEDGTPSRYRDSQWRNASASFSWATISHNGYTYNVPTFSGGTTTPPPPATADKVSITKAEYSSSRITVYATNTLKNQAQLTANYCSKNYPMSWSSSNNRWQLSSSGVSYCNSVTVTSSKGGSATSSVTKRY